MINIALLGCGRIGQMHADNLVAHNRVKLVSVFDLYSKAADTVAKRHTVTVANSADDIFNDENIDAVLVATATQTHADFIERAVACGKAVLCEKPIDLNLERVNQCANKIAGSKVPVQIGFNRRFDPGHRAAHMAVKNGDIGELHQIVITSRDPGMPSRAYYETAGGLLRDMTIHDFDLARYMLDDEPVEVFAIGGRQVDKVLMEELDDHDTAMIILRTADGKQCTINNHRSAVYGYDQRIELLGSNGMLQSDNRTPHGLKRFTNNHSEASEPYENFFIERYRQSFDAEIDAFVMAIENNTPPQAGFEDGRKALVLAEAAYRSLAEGRLVKVSEFE